MANRKETSERHGGYEKFELSPSSEYFLYGKGSGEDFAREVRRVKYDLKRSLYGPDAVAEETRKKLNAATVVTIITALIALAVMFLGAINALNGVFNVAENYDAITALMEIATVEGTAMKAVQVITAMTMVITLLIAVIGALTAKRPRVSGLVKLLTTVWFLIDIAALIAELVDMQSVPVGLAIIIIMSLTAVISSVLAGKSKRRE